MLGRFLRWFTFGHIRQLDRAAEARLGWAWAAGAGPAVTSATNAHLEDRLEREPVTAAPVSSGWAGCRER